MDYQNLIIFKFKILHEILKELEQNTSFKIYEVSNEKLLEKKKKELNNYIIVAPKKIQNTSKQIILDNLPIKYFKLIETINVGFLKLQYSQKSEFQVGKYKINLNSRELTDQDKILKLTEKETKIISYLSKLDKSVSIIELQSEVWGYSSELETHTVETHIYRLREKVFKCFANKNFIVSHKKGYKINLK